MVGNSYTYYNGGVDGTLRTFFASSRAAWYAKRLTLGGANWEYHMDQAVNAGTALHTALTSSTGGETSWGFVVFQERSHVPALCCGTDPWYTNSEFIASARNIVELDRKAEARGARTILYQTWGRLYGLPDRGPHMATFPLMNDALAEGYKHYASLITRPDRTPIVAPVGPAFGLIYDRDVAAGRNPLDSSSLFHRLYDPDATHPSALGTYLAACVIHAGATGESPVGLPPALGISGAESTLLQETAARAIAEAR